MQGKRSIHCAISPIPNLTLLSLGALWETMGFPGDMELGSLLRNSPPHRSLSHTSKLWVPQSLGNSLAHWSCPDALGSLISKPINLLTLHRRIYGGLRNVSLVGLFILQMVWVSFTSLFGQDCHLFKEPTELTLVYHVPYTLCFFPAFIVPFTSSFTQCFLTLFYFLILGERRCLSHT